MMPVLNSLPGGQIRYFSEQGCFSPANPQKKRVFAKNYYHLWEFFVDVITKSAIIRIAFSFLPLLFSSFSPPSAKKQGF
jgi:hypothetical protein